MKSSLVMFNMMIFSQKLFYGQIWEFGLTKYTFEYIQNSTLLFEMESLKIVRNVFIGTLTFLINFHGTYLQALSSSFKLLSSNTSISSIIRFLSLGLSLIASFSSFGVSIISIASYIEFEFP